MPLTVIFPPADRTEDDLRLEQVLAAALKGRQHRPVRRAEELEGLAGHRILFAVGLGPWGVNTACQRMLLRLRQSPGLMEGCVAGLIVDGAGELYTKSAAGEAALALNLSGCALLGRPLVEGTGSLENLRVQAHTWGISLTDAYCRAALDLAERLDTFVFPRRERPSILALHASSHCTSNTLDLWEGVRARLGDSCQIQEIGLRNGTLSDCSGCPYTTCLHFGEQGGCFYGGVMSEEVYPAVRACHALVMVAPNYNDALSANLTAFINRLTALFRQKRFYDKALFAIVVSGYSGGDLVARQLISALCMNKSFYLPGCFALIETANDPGKALTLPGIEGRVEALARRILQTFE